MLHSNPYISISGTSTNTKPGHRRGVFAGEGYTMLMPTPLIQILLLIAVLTLGYTFFIAWSVKRLPTGTDKMREIADAIREGAMAFLKRQYKILAVFVLAMTIVLYFAIGWQTAFAFVFGALLSAIAGNIGMRIATHANVRTAQAAKTSLSKALDVAVKAGAVMGMGVVALALGGIAVLVWGFDAFSGVHQMRALLGFAFGAGSIALFARVGGGIYTKAADVGADLVGKVEAGIPEDDPRNPAVVADNVGDNVGDIAGMGADLFESFVGIIISSMILGLALPFGGVAAASYPLALAAFGVIASIISVYVVRTNHDHKIGAALRNGLIVSSVLVLIGAYALSRYYFPGNLGPFWAATAGLLAGLGIGILTEYYTSAEYGPTKGISKSSTTGSATNIIEGLSVGMQSVALPTALVVAAIAVSYHVAGLYGIALAGVGMLSTLGISLAIDAYGPIADNAGGIAEMAGMGEKIRKRTDALDSAGNTTAAIGKGFALGSAAMTVLAFLGAFTEEVGSAVSVADLSLTNPTIVIGLIIGAMLPFLFSSMTMRAVSRAAFAMIEEVRRQFRTIKGLMAGKARADYAKCVDIATTGALKEMIAPGLLVILSPLVVGLLFGIPALAGLLAGALVSGMMLAMTMVNAGGAWDNAKKYIEKGVYGGKGSDAHKAAVTGDTVGDPFKDTSGPALNILIKLTSITTLVFVPIFLKFGHLIG